ncbi:hypothetical protein [Clostridium baratii]|uniref:hypothetical protein n=1 Tax=Clostridium baratii TaxID=1561 RepID=UPI0005F2D5E9|nr:hypothetical protein [Clostridium baratii]AQM58631.1 hypothetical protein NPD11_3026 [Clostridium baratii]KJU71544.1 hypothetical protein UC77_09010 [Clostridium baratii]
MKITKIPFDKDKTNEIRTEIGIANDDEEDIINIIFDSTLADEDIKVCQGYYIYNNTIGNAIFILLNNKAVHLRALLFNCDFDNLYYIIIKKLSKTDYLIFFNNK